MTLTKVDFFIPVERCQDCLKAIKALDPRKGTGGSSAEDKWFAWINTKEYKDAQTLQDALSAWHWRTDTDNDGNIVNLHFDGEIFEDEQFLFDAIAPFVKEGSYIQIQEGDRTNWRWIFIKRECIIEQGTLAWERFMGSRKFVFELDMDN